MATTSPDNLRTPDPGDPYNLVPDLATLAGDVQNALDVRGNAYKGTVSERVAFESTATPGMLWQDTDGIGMIWKRGVSAWVPAVWRWSGTTAQMNSFGANAPDGFEWFSTTNDVGYVRLNGVWEFSSSTTSFVQSVTPSGGSSSGGLHYSNTVTVTYPNPRPGQIPNIACSYYGAGIVTWFMGSSVLTTDTEFVGYCVRIGAPPGSGSVRVILDYS